MELGRNEASKALGEKRGYEVAIEEKGRPDGFVWWPDTSKGLLESLGHGFKVSQAGIMSEFSLVTCVCQE